MTAYSQELSSELMVNFESNQFICVLDSRVRTIFHEQVLKTGASGRQFVRHMRWQNIYLYISGLLF